jgi:transcriptional regulator with XRE-family HTH domain
LNFMDPQESTSSGRRVAKARRRKNWTQADLAVAMGRSVSWVAKIEGGHAPLDRRSVLDRLAVTLGVEVVELTGQPYRPDSPKNDSGHSGIPDLRLALQRASLPQIAAVELQPGSLADIVAELATVEALRQAATFTRVAQKLPGLIERLVVLQREQPRDELASLMVRACHIARVMANLTGHHDLAWMALERELAAAASIGAPSEQGAAAWDLCGAWLHAGAVVEARNTAVAALDQLDAYLGNDNQEIRQLWGALHLRAAVAFSRLWQLHEARTHIEEARRVVPEHGNVWQTQFNSPNLAIHEVEVSIELGRPLDAQRSAESVQVADLDSGERQAHFWICQARVLAMNGNPSQALDALLEAERIAGPHVVNRPLARQLVTDLLHQTRRRVRPELRRMATLMQIG